MARRIVEFYDPHINGRDAHGRTREQMLNWSHDKLERCHDYIQVLFPLPEGSMFSYNAPIIDMETMTAFRANPLLQKTLGQALAAMLDFYGFETVEDQTDPVSNQTGHGEFQEEDEAAEIKERGKDQSQHGIPATSTDAPHSGAPDGNAEAPVSRGFSIVRGSNFQERSRNWCVRMDHNHLRITRILRCLRVLGLDRECEAFHEALTEVYNDPRIGIGRNSMQFWTRAVRNPLHIAPDGTECEWLQELSEAEQTQK